MEDIQLIQGYNFNLLYEETSEDTKSTTINLAMEEVYIIFLKVDTKQDNGQQNVNDLQMEKEIRLIEYNNISYADHDIFEVNTTIIEFIHCYGNIHIVFLLREKETKKINLDNIK